MPILDDIMDHDLLGPVMRKGIEEGRLHERQLLRKMIEKRFGNVPQWADERLFALTPDEVNIVGLRIVDGGSIEEILT